MSASTGKWGDLGQRIVSGVTLAAIAVAAVWAGGLWIHLLVSIAAGLMVWELARMLDADAGTKAIWLGAVSGFALFVASYTPVPAFVLPLLIAPAFVGFGQLGRGRVIFMCYSAVILLSGFGLIALRDVFGGLWMAWLLVVVVASDVAGYFAGKTFGGPKFWPQVSPNKTWSGTIAGWVGAAFVGLAFLLIFGGGAQVIGVSIAVAMAAQMGDIAESAIKRHVGVKDSSALIPGHGGLLDRFDGVLGASLLLVIVGQFVAFPPVLG